MKNYTYGIFLILTLIACKHKVDTADEAQASDSIHRSTPKKGPLQYKDPLFGQYAAYLKTLDDRSPVSATSAANKYQELFKDKDKAVCDTAFLIFNEFYKKLAESLEEVNEKDTIDIDKYYGYTKAPKDIPANVVAYVKSLKDNGFDINEEEGQLYISQDRDLVAKYFYGLVSPIMKEYLEQINVENKQIYMNDASVVISADTLVDRTVWWERFEQKHTDFIWRDEVSATKKEYLHVLLKGSDNTEVLVDGKLVDYFKNAYAYLEKKYPGTGTYKLVGPYYHLLLKGDKAKAAALIDKYEKDGVFAN